MPIITHPYTHTHAYTHTHTHTHNYPHIHPYPIITPTLNYTLAASSSGVKLPSLRNYRRATTTTTMDEALFSIGFSGTGEILPNQSVRCANVTLQPQAWHAMGKSQRPLWVAMLA